MRKKFLVVGGVAGGASIAARLRRLSEDAEIIIFEKGPHVSFSNCSLPYHLSGTVKTSEQLVLGSPEKFKRQYHIEARVNHEVLSIDRENCSVTVEDLTTKKSYTESYDKLFLSPGAKPIVPSIPGFDKAPLFTLRNVPDIVAIQEAVTKSSPTASQNPKKRVSVVGGGFIGVEVAENLAEAGHEVTLIEAMDQILRPFDYEMVQILQKELLDNGISVVVSDKVTSYTDGALLLESGTSIPSDLIVLAIGVAPETTLAKEAGLALGSSGAIQVDYNFRTNDSNIYAVGDAIEVYNPLSGGYGKIPLAGPAQKQARYAADHAMGRSVDNRGFIGSSAIKVFNLNGASTGLTEGFIHHVKLPISYDTAMVIPSDKVGLMPDAATMHLKLIFETPTGRILGAQAIGKGTADKRIDVIATLIKMGGTVYDLRDLELCYAPPFSTAKDVAVMAGYVGVNLLQKEFNQVHAHQVRELIKQGATIIDVREPQEYAQGHLKEALNLPLSQLRERLKEIPKDRPVYIHCRSGQRSYNAVRALQNRGYSQVYNISGGFLGISYAEYFQDITTGRAPILTRYNFK